MRVLFITDNFPPEVNAPATRTFEHCREWIQQGGEITVLTCVPNFPQGRVYEGYKNKLWQSEYMEGIRVVRVWTFIKPNKGLFLRILDYMSFAVNSFLAGLRIKTDVIIATSPQFFTVISAFLLSRTKRKPWIFELRDLWPASIRAVGAMKAGRILRMVEKLELFMYRKSNLIIALTEAFKRDLIRRGIAPEKIRVVPNGSNRELFYPRDKDVAILRELNMQNEFVIGYIGTHGMAHGLDFIVETIPDIPEGDIRFLFIGDGAVKKDIMRIASDRRIQRICFLDPVPKDEVARYMSVIDAALVPLKRSDTFKTVIPSKIFEAASMLKPILLGVEGEAMEIVKGYHAGLCFEPENRTDFIRKVVMLQSDRKLYKKLQEGCRRLADDFDRRRLAVQMYNHIIEVVDEAG